jgi:hypothetical protein
LTTFKVVPELSVLLSCTFIIDYNFGKTFQSCSTTLKDELVLLSTTLITFKCTFEPFNTTFVLVYSNINFIHLFEKLGSYSESDIYVYSGMVSSMKSELARDEADCDRFRLRLVLRNSVTAANISAQCFSEIPLAVLRNRDARGSVFIMAFADGPVP